MTSEHKWKHHTHHDTFIQCESIFMPRMNERRKKKEKDFGKAVTDVSSLFCVVVFLDGLIRNLLHDEELISQSSSPCAIIRSEDLFIL